MVMALLVLGLMALLAMSNVFVAVLHAAAARAAWQGTVARGMAAGAVAMAIPQVEGRAGVVADFGPWPELGLPSGSRLEPVPGTAAWSLTAEAAFGKAGARSVAYFRVTEGVGTLVWQGAR